MVVAARIEMKGSWGLRFKKVLGSEGGFEDRGRGRVK